MQPSTQGRPQPCTQAEQPSRQPARLVQAMISELLNNSLEQTMVMGSHGGRGGRYMIGQTGQLAQRQAGAPAAVPRPHPYAPVCQDLPG